MKEFDLDAALNGEPVKLRNGKKAYIIGRIPTESKVRDGDLIYPVAGYTMGYDGYVDIANINWTLDGEYNLAQKEAGLDIIGMWEEPIKVEDLPKPFKPEENELHFYIGNGCVCRSIYWGGFDSHLAKNGQCFRTAEDAQKWLDFMKSMVE